MSNGLTLYSYFRSSASYRVRIALGLKGLAAEIIPVNLLKGEHNAPAYRAVNAQGLVPSLVLKDGTVLTQSLAIMEYLDDAFHAPALLPKDALGKARMRALAQIIACDIAPLGNSGTQAYLTEVLGVSEPQKLAWLRHWICKGLAAFEAQLTHAGEFCMGDAPGMADCCLVPQVYNARRFGCDLSPFPTIVRIDEACAGLKAFQNAHPARQPDAPEGTV